MVTANLLTSATTVLLGERADRMMMMMSRRFTFIDLFAGIGGMRLAFGVAGGQCVFSSEWDPFSGDTYQANFGERPRGDITKIDAFEIPQHDVLVAGFPCQPFSIAGVSKHKALGNNHGFLHATQGTLFFDVARIISDCRPRAFLLENVKNLLSHDRGRTFATVQRTLRDELGYDIHHAVIDSQWVVPQHRERVYIVGFRTPQPFTFPAFYETRPRLGELLEQDVPGNYWLTEHLWNYLQDYSEKHRKKGNGFGFGLIKDPDQVTRTLSARYYKDGSEILIPTLRGRPRRLTPRECARLMGFPDTFQIPVSDTQAYRQFGNSVVVPVVTEIAKRIADTLSGKRSPDAYVKGKVKVSYVNGTNGHSHTNGHLNGQGKLLEKAAPYAHRKRKAVSVANDEQPVSPPARGDDAPAHPRRTGGSGVRKGNRQVSPAS
jgi:DNA (cytosine-5)-methyltransferase 1